MLKITCLLIANAFGGWAVVEGGIRLISYLSS